MSLIYYINCVDDILFNKNIISMKDIKAHGNISCLEHSLFVSYVSYRVCRFLRWDYKAAARGGLLHDLFLYNQFNKDNYKGFHLITHPATALRNASSNFNLTEIEKDIIEKHMWPVTIKVPRYKESFIVNITDTLCAVIEMLCLYNKMKVQLKLDYLLSLIESTASSTSPDN